MATPPLPPQYKSLSHYLKLASDFDQRDPVISYWCRYHAVQIALAIDKSSPEAKAVIINLLSILEHKKKELHDNEGVSNDAVAEAYIEGYVLKIFAWADSQDRAEIFNKNVVKAFYNAGVLIDVLTNFNNGELSDEFDDKRKYAKWKAAYIHNCLKNGEVPKGGPMVDEDQEDTEGNSIGPPPPVNIKIDAPPPDVPAGAGFNQPSNSFSSSGFNQPMDSSSAGASYSDPIVQPQDSAPQHDVKVITKAQKYCKWATSALEFDDVNGAILNLEKALHLLKTGIEA